MTWARQSSSILLAGLLAACGGTSGSGLFDDGSTGGSTGSGGSGAAQSTGGATGTGGAGAVTGSGGGGNVGGGPPLDCGLDGTWATFIEVGVEWESFTIRPGAGTVKQWIISEREVDGLQARDNGVACGIASPFFSTILDTWLGVDFLDAAFDSGSLPKSDLFSNLMTANALDPQIGDSFETAASPLMLGIENLDPMAAWPDINGIQPFLRDHDQDSFPGITAVPLEGTVPGAPPGTTFSDPQLDIPAGSPQANPLFMAMRVQAALRGTLVSCDPPRVEGTVVPESLDIELRNVGCLVSGSGAPCSTTQASFIDDNLPQFVPNGTSVLVSIKVPKGTSCNQVREMRFQ